MAKKNRQIDIFEQAEPSAVRRLNDLDWPAPDRFPLNVAGRHVRDRVIDDLVESESPLIVAGYAAIDHIVGLLAQLPPDRAGIRLMFGSEPSPGRPERYGSGGRPFPKEVRD